MESSAFPNKSSQSINHQCHQNDIDDIENVEIDEYFLSPKIMQNRSKLNVFSLDALENTLFHFDCNSEGNALIGKSST